VRLLAVEASGAFAQSLSKEDCAQQLLPLVQKFAQVGARGGRCRTGTGAGADQQAAGLALQLSPRAAGLPCGQGDAAPHAAAPWHLLTPGCRAPTRPPAAAAAAAPQDKSWRVRFNVANQLVTLCDALGKDVTR
jgi:hypothetical protein